MIDRDTVAEHLRPQLPVPTGLKPSGQLSGRLRCVLFDVYGTLFISGSGDISLAARQNRQAAGIDKLLADFNIRRSKEQLRADFIEAVRASHAESRKNDIDFPEIQIDRIWMRVLGIVDRRRARDFAALYELCVNPVYPMPGLVRMLAALKQLELRMGIISNAQFFTPLLFKWLLGSSPDQLGFEPDLTFYSYRAGRAKPSAIIFQMALKALAERGIPAKETLFMGNDMRNDICPAAAAGMQTALFAGDARSLRLRQTDPDCRNLSANLVVTELMQLPALIQPPGKR